MKRLMLMAMLATSGLAQADAKQTFALDASLAYGHGADGAARMHSLLEVRPEYTWQSDTGKAFVTSARLRLDADDDIEPGAPGYESYWSAGQPIALGDTGSLELRDAYLSVDVGAGQLRFGKQQIVWGNLDGLRVLDVINPQDFRYFIIEDFDASRLTLWSAYADVSLGEWRAEFAVVPDSSGHVIPDAGAWFELRAPRFRFGAAPGGPGLPVETVRPPSGLDDTGFGARVTRQVGTAALSLVAYSGRDPEPLGRVTAGPQGPVVQRDLERRDTLGISADIGLGPVVLRLEHARHPDRFFNTSGVAGLDRVRRDQARSALGLDVTGPFDTFINIQYLDDRVSDAPMDLVRPKTDRLATVALRKTVGFDTWEFLARWYRSFTDGDSMATLSVQRALGDRTSIQFEAATFRGTDTGLFGQFVDRDMATLRLTHRFR
ncbi:MAG: DUF1302 family protein [Pseudomonadota bacterium]